MICGMNIGVWLRVHDPAIRLYFSFLVVVFKILFPLSSWQI